MDESSSTQEKVTDAESQPGEVPKSATEDDDVHADSDANAGGDESADGDVGVAAAASSDEDDLPEYEPLTPELVEDEAIRGDFMLRWSGILLALLMGWTVIQDTAVLTHIKSGQAIAANGFLPPTTDPLSVSAGERRWVNLSWLWDLTTSAVYGVAGESGLTLLASFIAVLTFWLLAQISLPNVPTWWGSVCGVLALVAAFPTLTPVPELVTLLGMASMLWCLHRWQTSAAGGSLWPTVLLLFVWCQFDSRAWIGGVVLLAFALGQWFETRGDVEGTTPVRGTSVLIIALCGLGAMLLHPFLWETWLSPLRLYTLEYPTLGHHLYRDTPYPFLWLPMWSPKYWDDLNYFNATGLLLMVVALVTLNVNGRRFRMSQGLMFVVVNAIAIAGGRELAVAGIVNAVIATLNAQEWYHASFRQTYSVETSELVFSRGGRAITVLAFFALGFVTVNGHLMGANGRRVGMGFDPQLQQTIVSYESVLEEAYDDAAFNFRPEQGDILNWVGQRPFLDSRSRLFAAADPESIVDEHLLLRSTLRLKDDPVANEESRAIWRNAFDTYGITQVLPRLSGAQPDYETFGHLMVSPDWALTDLAAATASFYRIDTKADALAEYVSTHRSADLVESLLRSRNTDDLIAEHRPTWPQPTTVYGEYFLLPHTSTPNDFQLARHYDALAQSDENLVNYRQTVAAALGAIRHVHRGLVEAPNHSPAYQILARNYLTLWRIERAMMQSVGLTYPATQRYLQTISAFQHAIACDPEAASAHYALFQLYLEQQRLDAALRHLDRFEELTGKFTLLVEDDPQFSDESQRVAELQQQLTEQITKVRETIDADLEAGKDRLLLIDALKQAGYLLMAVDVIEDDLTVIAGNPQHALTYGSLLLETGRTSEAYDQLQGLEGIAQQSQLVDWPMMASYSELIADDLTAALKALRDEHKQLAQMMAVTLMQTRPLNASGPTATAQGEAGIGVDPLTAVGKQLQMSRVYFDQILPRVESNELHQALICLESGQNALAEDLLTKLLKRNPVAGVRPLAELYLLLLSANPQLPPVPQGDAATGTVPDVFATPPEASAESTDVPKDEAKKEPDTPKATDDDERRESNSK